jgi:DNA-directed RNA polymerase subunit alpha
MMTSISKNWNELIKPNKVFVDSEKSNMSDIIVEPLERGYGLTLGNAMRRILLSSLQGAAVTSIKIEGVVHEFSSIDGVREDVSEIILNLKSLVLQIHEGEKRKISINAVGPCDVTADMIDTGHAVDVINKDLHICTLAEGSKLNMEIVVETGKGYVAANQNRTNIDELGVIPVDSLFSPIKRVFCKVENSRVGQVTDYDKLILSVETDGTITPETAVAFSARILQDQMQVFINFEEKPEELEDEIIELSFDPNLLKKVDELELSVRSQNCLKNDNIVYIGDLVTKSENQMLKTPNFGRKSLNEIKEILTNLNLSFGMDVSEWPPEDIEGMAKKYEDPYYK